MRRSIIYVFLILGIILNLSELSIAQSGKNLKELSEKEYQELKTKGLLPQPKQVSIPSVFRPENIIQPDTVIKHGKGLLIALDETFTQMPHKGNGSTAPRFENLERFRVDKNTGMLLAMYFIDDSSRQGTLDEIARAFLKTKTTDLYLRQDLNDLLTANLQESPMGYHITYQQTYEDIPVYKSTVVVTIDRNNKVVFLTNNYKPNLSLANMKPDFTEDQASSTVLHYLKVTEAFEGFPTSQLIIYVDDNETAYLAYKIIIAARFPSGSWEVIIDAHTMDILSIINLRMNSPYKSQKKSNKKSYVDGIGYIFNPDPLTSAGATYGDPGFTDNNDANSPQLEAERELVALNDITFDGTVYKLQGPYCTIEDWDLPTVAPVTETDPDGFQYTRDQSGFEDVMVYYHIDHIQRYIQNLGFNIPGLATNADPHGNQGVRNSFYSGALNKISFGEVGVDHAEDADLIWHEYGHAIQNAQRSGLFFGPVSCNTERQAMGEGFGDYWAGSYSKTLSLNNSDEIFTWAFGDAPQFIRPLNDPGTYPPAGGWTECHQDGQIWSAVLMEIWDDVGRLVTDKCVLQSHYLLADNPTMRDNAAAIIQADRSLYNGAHVQQMVDRFTARGFLLIAVDEDFNPVPFTNGTPPEYRNDDGSSSVIPLSFTFTFYGSQYNQVYVNNNGNLSFEGPYFEFTPSGFPVSDFGMIAAFWGDVDTRNLSSGYVYYKSEPNRFTVIYDRVGYYGSHSDKLNTFQIIITDGTDPLIGIGNNVCFSYADMQWTTGDASGGSGGFGGAPATVGANRGDGINFALVGRFDHEGIDYDGPGGNADGISYLDDKTFCFDLAQGAGTIIGTNFRDDNGNGAWDFGEPGLPGWTIRIDPGAQFTTTDANGEYFFSFLEPNTYTVSEVLKANWQQTYPAPPGTHTVMLDQGQTVSGIDFGNQAVANVQDLSVSVAGGPARPGFQKFYGITYENKGTIDVNGSVTFNLPPQLSYLESSPGGTYNSGTHAVVWDVGSVTAGSMGWLWAKAQIPATIALGTTLTSSAHIDPIAGDVNPGNNNDSETQTVAGSFDPNDKQVTPTGVGPFGLIRKSDTLTYFIRFQNVGTDTAFNIIVRDPLDDDLDIGTLDLGASSYPYTFGIVDRELVWTFANIQLPDSNVNEPSSHGFIKFRVRPNSSAVIGTEIENSAAIYFDFNVPVITNAVRNQIAVPPNITTTVLQNPAASKYADIVIVSDLVLHNSPNVNVWVGTDTTNVSISLISGADKVYKGSYVFTQSGTYFISTTIADSTVLDTTTTRTFGVTLAKPGTVTNIAALNGQANLQIGRHAINKETYFISDYQEEGEETIFHFGPVKTFNEPLKLEIWYDENAYADPGKLFIFQKQNDQWVPLNSQVNPTTHKVRALVNTIGEFKIGYDSEFSGSNLIPTDYALKQNYPNPFNPTTTIEYDLPQDGDVVLTIYSMLGQKVKTLYKDSQFAGFHRIVWDAVDDRGRKVASGVYFYNLKADKFTQTKKMLLLR